MKNIKFIFAAFISFAALSCEKESISNATPDTNPESNLIPLVLSTGEDTKTSLQSDGAIHWSEGDNIAVIDNGIIGGTQNSHSFSISNLRGSYATFTGKVRNSTTAILAVYPSDCVKSGNVGGLVGVDSNRDAEVLLPISQVAKSESFNDNLNISVAKTTIDYSTDGSVPVATSLTFKNVCSLLKFTLPETLPGEIDYVSLSSGTAIAGLMDIDYSSGTPSVKIDADQSSTITMTGKFEAGASYYFVLAPVELKGLNFSVAFKDGSVYALPTSQSIQMSMGKFRSIGVVDFNKMSSFSCSAEHKFDETSAVLTGTELKISFPSSDVKDLKLTVTNGAVTRTILDANLTSDNNGMKVAISGSDDRDWPYLPSGVYNITGSYVLGGKVITITESVVVPSPIGIKVDGFNAYTSYTKYLAKDIDAANSLNGSYIYTEATGVNVSSSILEKYTDLLYIEYKNGGNTSKFGTSTLINQIEVPLYGTYSDFKCYFDGSVCATFSEDCHVTGLPYVLNPAENDSVNPWGVASTNDILYVSWTGSALKVGGNSVGANVGAIKSFYVPGSETQINVTASASGSVTGGRTNANTGSVKLGGSSLVSSTAAKGGFFSGTKTVTFSETESMSISTSNSQLSCSVTYGLSEAHMLVKSLTILYR